MSSSGPFPPSSRLRALLGLLTAVATAPLGCSEDESSRLPLIFVEKQLRLGANGEVTCFAACAGTSAAPARLIARCEDTELPQGIELPEDEPDCGFVSGEDLIRVAVVYGVGVDPGTNLEAPKLATVVGARATEVSAHFDFPAAERRGDLLQPIAVAVVRAPLAPATGMSFRVTVPENVVVETDAAFSVTRTDAAALKLLECPVCGSCTLPSGVGVAHVEVSAPLGFANQSVELRTTLNGVPYADRETVPLESDGSVARGILALTVPDAVGRTLSVRTDIAGQTLSCATTLRAPGKPEVLILAAGTEPPDPSSSEPIAPPPRAFSEPDPICRTYAVHVHAPDPPPSGTVELATSVGVFADAQATTTLPLDGAARASTALELPADGASDVIRLTLGVEPRRRATSTLILQQTLPLRGLGTLFSSSAEPELLPTGTPAELVLSGQVRRVPDTTFAPRTRLLLRTSVTPSSDESLPCGTPLAPEALACDPTAESLAQRGGCLMIEPEATMDASGRYTVTLRPNLCFAGQLRISALSPVYTRGPTAAECIGELPRSDAPEVVGETELSIVVPDGG